MRVVFLAVDDEFAGEMQRPLYESNPANVVGSVVSSCAIFRKSKAGALWFVLRVSGPVFLAEMIRMKLVKRSLKKDRKCFPSQLAKAHGVELFSSADINDMRSITKLQSWKPDLIISTNFSHYIGKTVRQSIASRGCWNLHKSLLPNYRGMAPNFHALLDGATKVGATLHVVAKGYDSGDMIAQVEVPVGEDDSVYSLNRKTSEAGGKLLARTLANGCFEGLGVTPQPEGPWKTYTYPTREEVRAFRRRRLKF